MTAMISPFRDGELDTERLRANVEFQIEHGIDGLVPTGTTGESPTLSHHEHDEAVAVVAEAAAGRVPVGAGAGSNSTREALRHTRHAADVGAAGSLHVVPYYNKPTQEGMYRHFMTVAEAVHLPMVLYNIPGRTGVTRSPATIARLAEHPNLVAVKEATCSLDTASEIATLTDPESFTILAGDDSLTLPLMSVGGRGVVSVLSNIIPDRIRELTRLGLEGDFTAARRLHLELFPLFKGMFLETNPIPIKTAMCVMGMDTGELRLPLCQMSPGPRGKLEALLREHALA